MIPPFDPATGNLPPGIHEATWAEVVARYGYNAARRRLLAGLQMALEGLGHAGCWRAYLAGSSVTAKPEPGDFDVCWDVRGVDTNRLHFNFLETDNGCDILIRAFGGELYPAHRIADRDGTRYLNFFQRNAGRSVGIIVLDPRGVP